MVASIVSNQYFADILTGLICAVLLAVPALLWKWLKNRIKELMVELRPNGGDTLSSGDTVSRIETKVDGLIVASAAQKGHSDTVEAEVYRRLDRLETREQVAQRIEEAS